MTQKKIILFDFDGTIADSLPEVIHIFNTLAPKHNYAPIDAREIDRLRGRSAREIIRGLGIAKLKLPLVFRDGQQEFAKRMEHINVIPDMHEVIRALSQTHTLGIVTSNATENVQKFLNTHNLDLFAFIYSDKSIFGKGKILRSLLKKYQYLPSDVVYVGDEVRDIDAARQAKIAVISVSWGFNTVQVLTKNKPDAVANKPQDLLSFFTQDSDTIKR